MWELTKFCKMITAEERKKVLKMLEKYLTLEEIVKLYPNLKVEVEDVLSEC